MALLLKSLLVVVTYFALSDGQSIIPSNENCDPLQHNCRKGDLIAKSVADCCYNGPVTCDAINDSWWSRTVDSAVGNRCQPYTCSGGHRFLCGESETNSRCVCDDVVAYSLLGNRCRCQYWPTEPQYVEVPRIESNVIPDAVETTATSPVGNSNLLPLEPDSVPSNPATTPSEVVVVAPLELASTSSKLHVSTTPSEPTVKHSEPGKELSEPESESSKTVTVGIPFNHTTEHSMPNKTEQDIFIITGTVIGIVLICALVLVTCIYMGINNRRYTRLA